MASCTDSDTILLKCSESIITCQICMEIFESPRILPCQHSFCKECVVSLIQKHCLNEAGRANGTSFPCPVCRKDCKIRRKGKVQMEEHLKCFPENLLLKSLLDSVDTSNQEKMEAPLLKDAFTQHDGEEIDDAHFSSFVERNVKDVLISYVYLLQSIQYFIWDINNYPKCTQSRILNQVPRSDLTDLVYHVCTIPTRQFANPFRFLEAALQIDRRDILAAIRYIKNFERSVYVELEVCFCTSVCDWRKVFENSLDKKDTQTQTESNILQRLCYLIFLCSERIKEVVLRYL